jgi:hypothetical protein
MTTTAARAASIRPVRTSLTRIVAAGLAGGAVDFVYASTMGVLAGRGVARVWQGVAAGWLGEPAFEGGAATAPLGIVTHFAIAVAMAAAYALAAARFGIFYRRWALFAPLYGLVLYGVMYRVVLPLRWPGAGAWRGPESLLDVAAHIGMAVVAVFVLRRASPLTEH